MWYRYTLIIPLLFLYACASVFNPPGGPKDETPPKNLSVKPQMLAKNVKENKFVFEFDEYIKLNNPNNEVLISPPLKNRPDFKIKGKKLIVEFNDTLKPQTTYTINFGQAITDNNEGNKLVGLNYVFSTGDYIDSLSIKGKLKNAYDYRPAENIGVLLYRDELFSDSIFQTQKPFYYAISNSSGQFQFKYLRSGKYRVFALQDQNFNMTYDPPGEKIGFLDTVLFLNSETEINLSLNLFDNEKPSKILSYNIENERVITLLFNNNINNFEIDEVFGFNERIYQIWSAERDTLKLYYKYNAEERPRLVVKVDGLLDTLEFRTDIFTKDSIKAKDFMLKKSKSDVTSLLPNGPIQLNFSRPFTIPKSGIYLYEDSFKRQLNVEFEINPKNPDQLLVNARIRPEKRYDLVVTDSSIFDIYNIPIKAFKQKYQSKSIEDYGNLAMTLKELDPTKQYIFELLKGDKVFFKKIILENEEFNYSWKLIEPTNYQFRVVLDKDKNGFWTTGDLKQKRQPEPVYIYPEKIKVRANWDMEIEDTPKFNLH